MYRVGILILMMLVGCAPYPTDPASLRGIADGIDSATVQAKQASARQATATRAIWTEQAGQTVSALDMRYTELAATSTAIALAADEVQLQRTQGAATIEFAQRGQIYQARQTQIWLGVKQEERRDNWDMFMLWACGINLGIALLALVGLGWLFGRAAIRIREAERLHWIARPLPIALPPPADAPQVIDINAEAVDFLRTARRVNGAGNDKIPGWRDCPEDSKWHDSGKWQGIKTALERADFVHSTPRKWTLVDDYFGSIQGLLVAFEQGEVGLHG